MRPVAPLRLELLAAGTSLVVLGIAGLLASLAVGVTPLRGLVAFLVAGAAVGLVQHLVGTRWIRIAGAGAPELPPERAVEPRDQTLRRIVLVQGGAFLVLLILLFLIAAPFGATFGGVLAGIGAANLAAAAWISRHEGHTGLALARELGRTPFSSGRRPLYTLPRSADTLAT